MADNNEHNLKDLIHQFVHASGKQQLYSDRMVLEKWPEYMGEFCAKQSKCISLKNGILKVQVPNAAMRFELVGRKSTIIERINSDYALPVIKDIHFF